MKNILEEIVRYTHDLGFQKIVVETNEDMSKIQGQTITQTMHMTAVFKNPIPNFSGTIGMSNMNILSGFLKSPAFANPTIDVTNNKAGEVSIINIKSDRGHSGEYRLMSSMIAQRISKIRMAKNIQADIEFVPNDQFFTDFTTFKNILYKFDPDFRLKVSKDNVLMMVVGENAADGNKAEFPIVTLSEHHDLSPNTWPIDALYQVLKQAPSLESCKVQINDEQGTLRVIVQTEHANYIYDIPSVLT
jgi:hypothetical protein